MTEILRHAENTDRWIEDGLFPSALYAGLKQSTKRNGECTILFDGSKLDSGFVVGDGRRGFTYQKRHFYLDPIELLMDSHVKVWKDLGFDGFGTWLDGDTVYVDPVTICGGLWTATELAKVRDEKAIFDVLDKRCITIQ